MTHICPTGQDFQNHLLSDIAEIGVTVVCVDGGDHQDPCYAGMEQPLLGHRPGRHVTDGPVVPRVAPGYDHQ